jgi:hypothetical protein
LPAADDPTVQYIAKSEDVSIAQAQHRTLVQALASVVHDRVASEILSSDAGIFISDDGKIVFSILDPTPASQTEIQTAARAAGLNDDDVTVRQVYHSVADLRGLFARASAYIAANKPSELDWSGAVDIPTNSVAFTFSNVDPASAFRQNLLGAFGEPATDGLHCTYRNLGNSGCRVPATGRAQCVQPAIAGRCRYNRPQYWLYRGVQHGKQVRLQAVSINGRPLLLRRADMERLQC